MSCKRIYQTDQCRSKYQSITLIRDSLCGFQTGDLCTDCYAVQTLLSTSPKCLIYSLKYLFTIHAKNILTMLYLQNNTHLCSELYAPFSLHLCLMLFSGWPGEHRVRQLWTEMPFCCSDLASWQRWIKDQLLSGVLLIVFINEKTSAAG